MAFGLVRRLVGVAVIETHWPHRLVVLAGGEVVDDLAARAAGPDPVRWIDVRVRLV